MVKLVKHEKRIVLDGGLISEVGEALASSAAVIMARASSTDGSSVLEVMDQVLDSIGDLAVGPISEAAREGMATIGDVVDIDTNQVVVFVDGAVADIELIRAGSAPGAEIHILDLNHDGLEQIANVLSGRADIGAVHIISHGAPGTLSLGGRNVEFNALTGVQQSALVQIGHSMTGNGDILIYGCDFAAGEVGADAVQRMAALTGADVAASIDRTGAIELGGDWDLEVAQGIIESAIVLDHPTQQEFTAVLPAVSDVTGVNFGTDEAGNDLNIWLDASNAATLNSTTDGAAITSWTSQGRATNAVFGLPANTPSATTPDYSTASGGGVVFSGTSTGKDQLGALATSNGNVTGTDYEVFFVGSIDGTNSGTSASVVVSFTHENIDSDFNTGVESTSGARAINLKSGDKAQVQTNFVAGITTPLSSERHIVNAAVSGTSAALIFDNGTTSNTGTITSQTLNDNYYNIGGRAFWGNTSAKHNTAMTAQEVIIFDRRLNEAERTIVNNYLAEKWGLTISGDHYSASAGQVSGAAAKDFAGIAKESDTTAATATSGGLSLTNSTFLQDNGDYFMLANDAGTDAGGNSVTISSEAINYAGRKWSGDMTDGAGTAGGNVNLQFTLASLSTGISTNGANDAYRLIIDGSGNGFDSGDTVINSTTNAAGVVTFSGVSAAALDGKAFTIGVVTGDSAAPVVDLNGAGAGTTHTGTYGVADIGSGVSLDTGDAATVTDASNIANIKINLTSGFADGAAETLKFGDNTNINLANAGNTVTATFAAVTYNVAIDGGGTNVTISRQDAGTMTTSDAQDVIRNLQYQNTNGATATTGSRVFGFTLTDSASSPNTSSAVTSTIVVDTVAPVLDLDVPNGSSSDYSVYANASGVASGVSLENSDQATVVEASDAVTQVVITVGGVSNGTSEKIRVGGMDFDLSGNTGVTVVTVNAVTYNVQVSNNGATVTITKEPSGNMTASQVQDVIRDLTYKNTAGGSVTDGTRTFQFAISDTGGNASTARTASVLVDTTAPVLNLDADATYATTVNGASAGTGVSVDDAGTVASVTEAGDAITQIVITASGVVDSGNERLVIGSTNFSLTANGGPSTVTVGGQSYSISVTNSGSTFTITKSSGTITAAQAAEVVQNIVYQNTTGTPTSGARAFAFVLTDSASNTSATATSTITVDTTAPTTTATIDSISVDSGTADFITNDNNGLTIVGTLSTGLVAGEKLEYSNNNGASWTDITGSVTGTAISHADATLTSSNTVKLRVTDAVDNAGAEASQAITIDATAPTTTVTINSISTDSGAADFITNDNDGLTIAATLSTGLVAGEKLEYSNDNGVSWTDITGSVSGTAVSHADATLTSTNTIKMRVSDVAANSAAEASQLVTIDTTAPTTTITIASISTDSGAADFVTSDNDGLTVVGTLSTGLVAGETLQYSNDNGATWTDINGSVSGTAISHADATLTSSNTVKFRVIDTAGNTGTEASQAITIDATAPVIDLDPSNGGSVTHTATVLVGNAGVGDGTSLDDGADEATITEASTITQLQIVAGNVDLDGANEALRFMNGAAAVRTITMNGDDGPTALTVGGVAVNVQYVDVGNTFTITAQAGNLSAADVQAIVRSINYLNTTGPATAGDRTFDFTATDLAGNTSAASRSTISLSTNSAPAVDLNATDGGSNDYSTSVKDATNGVSLDDAAVITDDSNAITTISILVGGPTADAASERIGWGVGAGNEVALNAGNSETGTTIGGVSADITYTNGTRTIEITKNGGGNFTGAEAQAIVRALEYRNSLGTGATDGARTFAFTLTDSLASASTVRTATVTMDNTAPNAPSITTVTDDQGSITGAVSSGGRSDDTALVVRVSLAGTNALAGDSVQLRDSSANLGAAAVLTGTDIANGYVDITTPTLSNATTYAFNALITDVAGNTGSASASHSVTIDTTAPAGPTIGITDNALKKGETTTVTFTFAEAVTGFTNADVTAPSGTLGALSSGDGGITWTGTFTPTDDLEDATNVFTVATTYTDIAGNTGTGATSGNYAVDTLNPGAPGTPDLTAGTDTGSSSTDNVTGDNTPTFTGTGGTNGDTVTVFSDGVAVGNGTVQPDGSWTVTTSTLADGSRNITARYTDPAGNQGAASGTLAVTIDTGTPSVPAAPDLASGSDSGTSNTDDNTSDNTPTFTGTGGTNGDTVTIYSDGVAVGTGTVQPDGSWSVTTSALADGTRSITATYKDTAGNESTQSTALPVVIDTANPGAPNTPDLIAGSDLGNSATDDLTSDNTPTFSGTGGVSGHTVTIYDGANPVGTGTVQPDGSWTVTASTLADGAHNISARYTDLAGNQGVASGTLVVTVETVAPGAPVTPDLAVGSDSGASNTDNNTNDTTPTFTGTGGTNGDTVTIYADGSAVGTGTVQPDGSWSVTTSTLANGNYNITARYTDPAGNQGVASTALPVVIDAAAPTAPTVSTVSTTSATPTITGTVALGAGESLSVVVNGQTYLAGGGQLTVVGNAWTLVIPPGDALTEGTYPVTATVTDTAGNATSDATTNELAVDLTPPGAPVVSTLGVGDTTVSGTAEPGATVQVTLPGGGVQTVTVAGNGTWTLTGVGPFTAGQTVVAKAIDAAGNESPTDSETAIQTNTAPTLGANAGWSGAQGATGQISASQLSVADAQSSAANIVFTVTGAPANGSLTLNGAALAGGATFTQDDINNGRISYVHSGNGSTSDNFRFTASDGQGGVLGEQTFNFTVAAKVVTTAPVNPVPVPAPTVTTPVPTLAPVGEADGGQQSLFTGDIGGNSRSGVQLGGISGSEGSALGGGFAGGPDNGPLSPGGQAGTGGEVGSVFGDGQGLGSIQPAAGGRPGSIGEPGSPDGDIQRFANTTSPDAQLSEGAFGDLGSDLGLGDGPDLAGNGGNDGLSDLNGNAGGPILFTQAQGGDFGVRAGDFFRIFTDAGQGGQDGGGFDGVFEGNNPPSATNGQGGAGQGQGAPSPSGPPGLPGGNPQGGEEEQFFVLPPGLDGAGQPGPQGQEGQPPAPEEGDQQPAPGPQGQNNGGVQA